jgi:hypothetical protein
VTQVGRLPVRGEIISGPGDFEIEVLDADPRRVKRCASAQRKDRANLRQRELPPPRAGAGCRPAASRQRTPAIRPTRLCRSATSATGSSMGDILPCASRCDHARMGLEARGHRLDRGRSRRLPWRRSTRGRSLF